MKDLGNIQWIFHKTGNVTDLKVLKANVIKALKKADGSPIDELDIMLKDKRKFAEWMGLPANQINSKTFIEWLDTPEHFELVFKVVN